MGFVVTPVETDITYQVAFKEPNLEWIKEERRIFLIDQFLKAFELRLNDIKFNNETPSSNYINFSRFYNLTFFSVSFGFEEITAVVQRPQDINQTTSLLEKLSKVYENSPISKQKFTIRRHLAAEGNTNNFLQTLNPYCPGNFKELLHGRGVYYTLKIPEHELITYITLVSSLFVSGGLFFSIEFEFSPSMYSYKNAFKIVMEKYTFILKELNLKLEEDA